MKTKSISARNFGILLGYLRFRLSILTVMWMQLISLNKVIFEDPIFTFKCATNGSDLFSIITSSSGNKFFDSTHVIGRPFWCQNNGKCSSSCKLHIINCKLKRKPKKKRIQWITCTNYNLRIKKKKLKTKTQEIILNNCKHWRCLCCNLFDYSCVPLISYFPKSSLANFIYPKISRKEKHFSTEIGKSSPSKNAWFKQFFTFFFLFLSKSNNGSAALNCRSLTEFTFNINERLTQLEKYGKKTICIHVNLSVYSQQRRQKQKRQGNNSPITKIMKYNWRKTRSGNMFIFNLTVNGIFVQSKLFKLRHLFTVAIWLSSISWIPNSVLHFSTDTLR